jgi:hypothetical protein
MTETPMAYCPGAWFRLGAPTLTDLGTFHTTA